MKLLFETVNGKKVLKEFKNGTLAKNFIVKNKDKLFKAQIMEDGYEGAVDYEKYRNYLPGDAKNIKDIIMKQAYRFQGNMFVHFKFLANEVEKYILSQTKGQIMEGPLGSGGWTPKKAYHNFKKGHERLKNLQAMDKTKDSFGNHIHNYLADIASEAGKSIGMKNSFGVGRNEKGYYIGCFTNGYKTFNDEDQARQVKFTSEKYDNLIYMPKLTKYIENHESLPSRNQIFDYMKALIEKRYENNLNKMKNKKPINHMSKTDVEDF